MSEGIALKLCGPFRVHSSAARLPLITGEAWEEFKRSIRQAGGNKEPVVVAGDLLIDGRNRVRAVEELRAEGHPVELLTRDWAEDEPETVTEFILRTNVSRRHLTDDQRAAIAIELEPLIKAERAEQQLASRIQPGEVRNPNGRAGKPEMAEVDSPPPSVEKRRERNRCKAMNSTVRQLATRAGVTEHRVKQVKKAIRDGGPGVKEQLLRGEVTAKEINRKTRKPKEAPDPQLQMHFRKFVKANYRSLLNKHPVTDHAAVRRYLLKLIKDEQKKFGEGPSKKAAVGV